MWRAESFIGSRALPDLVRRRWVPHGEWGASLRLRAREDGIQEPLRAEVVAKDECVVGDSKLRTRSGHHRSALVNNLFSGLSPAILLMGFLLAMLMFGTRIETFLNE